MKFLNYLLYIFLSPLFIPILFILFIISPLILIRFGIIAVSRIGAISQYQQYLIMKKEDQKKKIFTFDFLSLSRKSCNKHLKKIFRRNQFFYSPIISRYIIDYLSFFFGKKNKFIIPLKDIELPYLESNGEQLFKFTFTKKEIYYCLSTLGITSGTKWICIHNRDSAYLNYYYGNKLPIGMENFSYHNYRDFDVNTMFRTSEYFAKNNFHVFRIGQHSNQKLITNNSHIVDLVNDKRKSDILDLFLLANCSFFVGCDSGPWVVPFINNKPQLITNYTTIGLLEKLKHLNIIYIFKRFRFKHNKKYLSIKDIYLIQAENICLNENYLKLGIELVPNDSETILQTARELYDRTNNNYIEDNQSLSRQERVWELINFYSKDKSILKRRAIIGDFFLQNNLDLLD